MRSTAARPRDQRSTRDARGPAAPASPSGSPRLGAGGRRPCGELEGEDEDGDEFEGLVAAFVFSLGQPAFFCCSRSVVTNFATSS